MQPRGERKLGVFVGSDEDKQKWVEDKVETWVARVKLLEVFERASY